jgi:hypothetical protein
MTAIPKSALLLGLAGLIPFLATACALLIGQPAFLAGLDARIMLHYGTIILAFMSGVLWGFATKAEGRAAAQGYILSVIPALWAFFTTMGAPLQGLYALILGFLGLLGLDWHFWHSGLAPAWWMHLRLILSAVVLACLAIAVMRTT